MPSGSDWGNGGRANSPASSGGGSRRNIDSINNDKDEQAAIDEVDRLNNEIVKLNRQIGAETDATERDLLRAQKDALTKKRKRLQDLLSEYAYSTLGMPF